MFGTEGGGTRRLLLELFVEYDSRVDCRADSGGEEDGPAERVPLLLCSSASLFSPSRSPVSGVDVGVDAAIEPSLGV
jgi:hypothetical protein